MNYIDKMDSPMSPLEIDLKTIRDYCRRGIVRLNHIRRERDHEITTIMNWYLLSNTRTLVYFEIFRWLIYDDFDREISTIQIDESLLSTLSSIYIDIDIDTIFSLNKLEEHQIKLMRNTQQYNDRSYYIVEELLKSVLNYCEKTLR